MTGSSGSTEPRPGDGATQDHPMTPNQALDRLRQGGMPVGDGDATN